MMQQDGTRMQGEDATYQMPITQFNVLSYRDAWKDKPCHLWDQKKKKKKWRESLCTFIPKIK